MVGGAKCFLTDAGGSEEVASLDVVDEVTLHRSSSTTSERWFNAVKSKSFLGPMLCMESTILAFASALGVLSFSIALSFLAIHESRFP